MSRPLSWYPLASADPVPGDPATVRTAGTDYQDVARAIQAAADALAQIADVDGNVSYAVDQIREKATEVAEDIRKAHDRYDRVGGALVDYASALDSAQVESEGALTDAKAAQNAIDAATTTIANVSQAASHVNDPAAQASFTAQLSRARQDRDDAEVRLAAARLRLENAITSRDAAVRTAVDKVEDITSHDGLRDNLWENLNLGEIFTVISDIAGVIASVAGILSLVLCWVPVLGQALAAVALIASAVKLLMDLGLAVFDGGSWADVAWGVFAVASFGVGRVLSSAAQGLTNGALGIARRVGGQVAAMSKFDRLVHGFPLTSSGRALQTMLGPTVGSWSRATANGFARQAQSARWLGDARQALGLRSLFSDAAQAGPFFNIFSPARMGSAWSTAWGQATANFSAAGGNVSALFAASQADGALVNALRLGEQIAPNLAAYGNMPTVLGNAMAARGGSAVSVLVGAVDSSGGMQPLTEGLVTGAPYQMPVVDSVQSVIDWFGPSPAEQLNLPR